MRPVTDVAIRNERFERLLGPYIQEALDRGHIVWSRHPNSDAKIPILTCVCEDIYARAETVEQRRHEEAGHTDDCETLS